MKLIAKTLFGLEPLLESELLSLGAKSVLKLNRAVEFEGDLEMMYRVNVHSRLALKVLKPILSYKARSENDFYECAKRFQWSKVMRLDQSFVIDSTTHGEQFTHSHYAGLKLKDAIVDHFREATGDRPSIDQNKPDITINLHIADRSVSISLDSSGSPLNKRGYRTESNDAPVSEILAAAMILQTDWDGITPFLDPMTGSGTIAIEAAMIARNIAPGLRRAFGFQKWMDYDDTLFDAIIKKAESNISDSKAMIVARDFNMGCLGISRRNASRAGVAEDIVFDCVDFMKSEPIAKESIIVMNPPYGERLDDKIDLGKLYHEIGFRLKHNYPGQTVWIISSNLEAMKRIGLKPDKKIKLFNGSLECRYNMYSLFAGKRIDQLRKGSSYGIE